MHKITLVALSAAVLAGCGTNTLPTTRTTATVAAQSDAGLKAAFTSIHKAIFTSMDLNKDGWLDDTEAAKHMTTQDFQKADTAKGWGSANKLSRTEFVDWATHTFWWFHDDQKAFADRFRKELAKTFNRMDENRDGNLAKLEISGRDLAKLKLTFDYDKLNLSVPILKVPADKFAAADKTGDGKLNQSEFEDLYVEVVIDALGGTGDTPPAPPAPAPAQ
jgi:Ca2+-binding EF-hand superfamily protein